VASWISQQDLEEFSSASFFANGIMTGSGSEVKEKRSRRQARRSDLAVDAERKTEEGQML